MKILLAIKGLHKVGGVTTFVGELSNALINVRLSDHSGIDVAIASYVPIGGVGDFKLDERVRIVSPREADGEDWDVVHVNGLWDREIIWASGFALKRGIPLVWSPHGMLSPWALRYRFWKKLIPWCLCLRHRVAKAAAIHVTSAKECDWVRDVGAANMVVEVPLGTRFTMGCTASRSRDKKIVLFVGRLHQVKGLDNLMRAWAKVVGGLNSGIGVELRLVGPDDGGYSAHLKKIRDENGLGRSVVFVGPKYDSDLEVEYRNAWVTVLPSYTENFGASVVDSLACGTPAIASRNTPWKDIENRCGWWVENDVETLAKTIVEALSLSDGQHSAFSAAGLKLVEERYTWDAVALRMMGCYLSVCQKDA